MIGWCRFDRESREVHHLTVEVADGGGEGAANTNTAELVIRVADTNDNAPEFSASQYQVNPVIQLLYSPTRRSLFLIESAYNCYHTLKNLGIFLSFSIQNFRHYSRCF